MRAEIVMGGAAAEKYIVGRSAPPFTFYFLIVFNCDNV